MIRIFRAGFGESASVRTLAMELRESLRMLDAERTAYDDALYLHQVDGWLLDPATEVLLATVDGDPCGYLVFQRGQLSGACNPNIVTIRGFYCRKNAQSRGIPGMLYRRAMLDAKRVGVAKAQVMVRWGHEDIAKLACDHGFKPVAVVLELELTNERRQSNLRTGAVGKVHSPSGSDSPQCDEPVPELAVLSGHSASGAEGDRQP